MNMRGSPKFRRAPNLSDELVPLAFVGRAHGLSRPGPFSLNARVGLPSHKLLDRSRDPSAPANRVGRTKQQLDHVQQSRGFFRRSSFLMNQMSQLRSLSRIEAEPSSVRSSSG
jgi:hypothetical protein